MIRHRAQTWGPYLAASAVLLALLLFFLAGLYTFRQQQHVDSQLCKSSTVNRAALRTSWEAVRRQLKSASDDPEAVDRFVDAILKPIPVLECIDNKPVPKEKK